MWSFRLLKMHILIKTHFMHILYIKGHLERTLNKAKAEITDYTENKLDKQKYLATEKAIAKMDKYSRQEVQDNEWLKREVKEIRATYIKITLYVGERSLILCSIFSNKLSYIINLFVLLSWRV